jgi:asparagine synthase (glutamine-hydrolysing)
MKHCVPDRWYLRMSGICGSTNDSQRTHVAAMNAAMATRGPGGDRTYTDFLSGMSLGAQGPSIDVKGGQQPVTNEDGTVWAALNGEVYNHHALRETLGGDGHRFASAVETEVLVHLYEKHGGAMVHGLEGMYTFALWDARQQKLVLVRDRFGEKPLFYAERCGDLLFASEFGALLAGMNREPELDSVSIDAFFVFGYLPESTSIVRGAMQLPPGHVLSWERRSKRVHVEPYWAPGSMVSAQRPGGVRAARGGDRPAAWAFGA